MKLTPLAPVLSNLTSTSFLATITSDGNTPPTFYAFKVVTGLTTSYANSAGTLQLTPVYLNVSSLNIIGLTFNTIYTVSLAAASDAIGTNVSTYSPAASAMTINAPDTVKAVHVTNLLAERGFLIEWAQNLETNIVNYRVYRSPSPTDTGAFTLIAVTIPPVLNYIDRVPFTFGLNFYYKVTAVDNGGTESNLTASPPVSEMTFHSFDEQPFPTSISVTDFVESEIAGGIVDQINTVFTTANLYRTNSLQVYLNGVLLNRITDYNEGPLPGQFTFTDAPDLGGVITVSYIKLA